MIGVVVDKNHLFNSAQKILGPERLGIFEELVDFVMARFHAAEMVQEDLFENSKTMSLPEVQSGLHGFLREEWDVLDGVGRVANCLLYQKFSDSGLQLPEEMTRQCTLYTVRQALHRHPDAEKNPISSHIWNATRNSPSMAYRRLSFLYNLSLFVNLPLLEGGNVIPGYRDIPQNLRNLVERQNIPRISVLCGVDEMHGWMQEFGGQCWELMAEECER